MIKLTVRELSALCWAYRADHVCVPDPSDRKPYMRLARLGLLAHLNYGAEIAQWFKVTPSGRARIRQACGGGK